MLYYNHHKSSSLSLTLSKLFPLQSLLYNLVYCWPGFSHHGRFPSSNIFVFCFHFFFNYFVSSYTYFFSVFFGIDTGLDCTPQRLGPSTIPLLCQNNLYVEVLSFWIVGGLHGWCVLHRATMCCFTILPSLLVKTAKLLLACKCC